MDLVIQSHGKKHVIEEDLCKFYVNSKMTFCQKSDYTSLNCHLAKFDSNVMTVNGKVYQYVQWCYLLYISLFHTPYTAQFLGKISQSNIYSVCSSS